MIGAIRAARAFRAGIRYMSGGAASTGNVGRFGPITDLVQWTNNLGTHGPTIARILKEKDITGENLFQLTDADLKELLGVGGPMITARTAIAQLKGAPASAVAEVPPMLQGLPTPVALLVAETIKGKDETIKGKDEAIKGKDEAIKGKDEAIKGKDDSLRRADSEVKRLSTELFVARGKLTLRAALEAFEFKYGSRAPQIVKKSERSSRWQYMLEQDSRVRDVFGATTPEAVTKWIEVAVNLYRHGSEPLHTLPTENLAFNTQGLSEDEKTCAKHVFGLLNLDVSTNL